MTCIVGLADTEQTVWMGCDTLVTNGDAKETVGGCKIFPVENMLIGGSGAIIIVQRICYKFKPPIFRHDEEPIRYMITEFMPSLEEFLMKETLSLLEPDGECTRLVVGFNGCLFTVGEDRSVVQNNDNIAMIGSGEMYARGAYFALPGVAEDSPEDSILTILASVEKCTVTVANPFEIYSIDTNGCVVQH